MESDWLTKKLVFVRRHQHEVVFSSAAKDYLKTRYVEIRESRDNGRVPINARVVDGWLRISTAVALFRHAWLTDGEVSAADAKVAVDLWMRTTGRLVATSGVWDVDRLEGVSSSQRKQYEAIIAAVRSLDSERGGSGVTVDELQLVMVGVSEDELESALAKLVEVGDLFKPRPDRFKVLL